LLKKFLILILLFEANLQFNTAIQTLIKISGTVIGYSAIVKRKYTMKKLLLLSLMTSVLWCKRKIETGSTR
jgi:hypothetical protein